MKTYKTKTDVTLIVIDGGRRQSSTEVETDAMCRRADWQVYNGGTESTEPVNNGMTKGMWERFKKIAGF
jgi:hypothetical protein